MKIFISILLILNVVFFIGCSSSDTEEPISDIDNCQDELAQLEVQLEDELDIYTTDSDFTLYIKSKDGRSFLHSTGSSNEFVSYKSASTSKMVAAAVILSLVKDNILSLEDNPQKYIPTWPTTGNLSNIKLKHLLSFTSGLSSEASCINDKNSDFETCVDEIASANTNSKAAEEEFYYSSSHLQVAGLMAIRASGLSSWSEVFDAFKLQTNLFLASSFDLPSSSNPRLAGGMHWIANDYIDFLDALYNKTILNTQLIDAMSSSQRGSANVGYSPILSVLGEDWHYGYGMWIENDTGRVSSVGAYGAYPFIDNQYKYYGIVARKGSLGTFRKGIELYENVSSKLQEWALKDCN